MVRIILVRHAGSAYSVTDILYPKNEFVNDMQAFFTRGTSNFS